MKSAILLDRDGTIIVDKNYLNSPDHVEFLPNAMEGLRAFIKKGHLLIVVTNQSGVARGLVQENNIVLIHKRMDELLTKEGITISAYYYNTAGAESDHPDRKPNPGMLLSAIRDWNLDPKKCWMIGDRQADIEAGERAGVRTLFIENATHSLNGCTPTHMVKDLLDASRRIG